MEGGRGRILFCVRLNGVFGHLCQLVINYRKRKQNKATLSVQVRVGMYRGIVNKPRGVTMKQQGSCVQVTHITVTLGYDMVELRTGNSVSFLFDSQAMIRPPSPESQLHLWVANSESGGKQSSSDSKVVS